MPAKSRLANIRLLEKYAAEYGLRVQRRFGFVRGATGKSIRYGKRQCRLGNANVVRIMSIHKSRAWSFHYCIIAGCGRKLWIDTDDLRMHPQLGVGITPYRPGDRRAPHHVHPRGHRPCNGGKRFRRGAARVLCRDDPCQREAHSAFHRENIDTNSAKLAAQITEEETVPPYTVSNASAFRSG